MREISFLKSCQIRQTWNLKQKTQVFLNPTGDHYRTRLTHTLEVSQIARTISRALRLNEDLTEAIALGHDLGHTPFGHAGESVLNEISPNGFKHYRQSVRVVDYIEKDGRGLNLTHEVRDGILKHTDEIAETREGFIVRCADVIAFINHDIEDAIRAGIIKSEDLPKNAVNVLGATIAKDYHAGDVFSQKRRGGHPLRPRSWSRKGRT